MGGRVHVPVKTGHGCQAITSRAKRFALHFRVAITSQMPVTAPCTYLCSRCLVQPWLSDYKSNSTRLAPIKQTPKRASMVGREASSIAAPCGISLAEIGSNSFCHSGCYTSKSVQG